MEPWLVTSNLRTNECIPDNSNDDVEEINAKLVRYELYGRRYAAMVCNQRREETNHLHEWPSPTPLGLSYNCPQVLLRNITPGKFECLVPRLYLCQPEPVCWRASVLVLDMPISERIALPFSCSVLWRIFIMGNKHPYLKPTGAEHLTQSSMYPFSFTGVPIFR